jgi:hypothetical protein
LSIVWVWRNMKMVEWYLMQHKKDHSLLFDNINGVVYAINWISQPVKEMADNCDLPLQIATVLLPFENWLIRDGIITRSNIYYSWSIKNTLKNDMKSIIMTIWISQTLWDESQATETTKQEKSALQDVVYMMSDDPTYYKNSRLIDLVKKYPLCEAYYHTQWAKKEILEYRKKAKVLWISWYYVALFGNCISATGLSKTSTQEQAESIVPKEYHDKIEIKKIS